MEENFINTGSTLQRTPQNTRQQHVCMISETSKRPRSKTSPDQSPEQPRYVEMSEFIMLKNRITVLEDLEWIVKSKDRVIEDLSNKITKNEQLLDKFFKRLDDMEKKEIENLSEMQKLQTKISELTTRLDDIRINNTTMESEPDASIQEKGNPPLTSNKFLLSDLFKSKGKNSNYDIAIIEKVSRETKAKENKASNIIISGIEESKNDNKLDIEEDDKLAIVDLLKELGIAPSANLVKKSYRISKTRKENKPALLKIELKDKEAANNILARAKKLKEIERYKGVFINRDLTKNEIEVERAGRKECLERNEKLDKGQGRHKYGIDYTKTPGGIEYFWGLRSGKICKINRATRKIIAQ